MTAQMKYYWKTKLSLEQQRAAEMLVDNEFRLLSDDGKKLTMEQIGTRVGVTRQTIHNWKKEKSFIGYMNEIAGDRFSSYRAEVFSALIGAATGERMVNKIPSSSAIKLFLQTEGLLRNEVSITDERKSDSNVYKTEDEIKAEMDELAALLNSDEETIPNEN